MNALELPKHFERIGARLVVYGEQPRRYGPPVILRDPAHRDPRAFRPSRNQPYALDIRTDEKGEHFRLDVRVDAPNFEILQAQRDERHLLLFAKEKGAGGGERLLCGHDERHWFVSSIAERVSTVDAARKALLPRELRHQGLNKSTLKSRHNDVFKRQGEWFFVPVTDARLLDMLNALPIHEHEPIQRGAQNKKHWCQELVRTGGVTVRLAHGREYSSAEWADLDPKVRARLGRVEERTKDMTVYVRGRIEHPDHATITLRGWHQVLLNGELVSSNVTFYD